MRNVKPRIKLKPTTRPAKVIEIKPPSPHLVLISELEETLEAAKSGELVGLVMVGMDQGGILWNSFMCHPDHDHKKLNYFLHKTGLEHDIWSMLKDTEQDGTRNCLLDYFVSRHEIFG